MRSPGFIPCPHCQADLRECGVLEYGVVTFEIDLVWDADVEAFSMRDDDKPRYDECLEIDWACRRCKGVLPTNPDDL